MIHVRSTGSNRPPSWAIPWGGRPQMQFASCTPGKSIVFVVVDILPGKYDDSDRRTGDSAKFIDLPELTTLKKADLWMSSDIPDVSVRQLLLKNLARNERGSSSANKHEDDRGKFDEDVDEWPVSPSEALPLHTRRVVRPHPRQSLDEARDPSLPQS